MKYEDYQFLAFDRPEDGVLLITLNRPEAMNATNARMHWELTRIWDTVRDDAAVRAAVVTGAGDRAFSAGGDLSLVEAMTGDPQAVAVVMKEVRDIVFNMLACEKPIISAINGVAVGAGLAVALMADVSIMAAEAKLTDGHARLGVGAGDHAAIIWPLLCGMSRAKYYLMSADFIDGREAERIGLVTFCVPREELMKKALDVATKFARGSQTAIQATKMSLNGWLRLAAPIFENSVALEMLSFLGADAREGLAALKAKRAPDFPSARTPG